MWVDVAVLGLVCGPEKVVGVKDRKVASGMGWRFVMGAHDERWSCLAGNGFRVGVVYG